MKLKNVLLTLGLALGVGSGVAAVLVNNNGSTIETRAAIGTTAPYYVKGAADNWVAHELSDEVKTCYFKGIANPTDAYAYTYTNLTIGDWSGFYMYGTHAQHGEYGLDYLLDTYPTGANIGGDGNLYIPTVTGDYTFFVAKSLGSYDEPSYGLSCVRRMGQTTLTVSFNNPVPEYADIYLPGTFNNWAMENARMTPNETRTVFTYSLEHSYVFSQKYKIVADYTFNESNPQYTLEITKDDQSIDFVYGTTAYTMGQNLDCDLSLQELPEGSYLSISFANAVPEGVAFYLAGSMNGWSNTMVNTKFVPQAGGTEFRVDLTALENVYANKYHFTVVAMSENNYAEHISYDYVVLNNIELVLSAESAANVLATNLSYNYLNEVAAHDFADRFVTSISAKCDSQGLNSDGAAISTIWSNFNTEYTNATELQGIICNANGSTRHNNDSFGDFDALYVYIYENHGTAWELTNFTGWNLTPRGSYSSLATLNSTDGQASMAIVLIASATALVATAGFFFLRRRKEQ